MKRTFENSKGSVLPPLGGKQKICTDTKGVIFDIKKYAIHDGPGIRTTVFLKGCPLKCNWCHNPESWYAKPERSLNIEKCSGCGYCAEHCPNEAIRMNNGRPVTDGSKCTLCGNCVKSCPAGARDILGKEMSVEEIVSEVEKDVVFYDESGGGVTFSGGEPLAQPRFLYELLKRCKEHDINTAVETSSFAERKVVERIVKNTDTFICDFKCADSNKHKQFTGVGNELIADNIRFISSTGKGLMIRLIVVPGFNDDAKSIEAARRFTMSLSNVDIVDILPYNRAGIAKAKRLERKNEIIEAAELKPERIEQIADEFRNSGFKVSIGG